MRKRLGPAALTGLILAAALTWAPAGFAQPWGPGMGRQGQGTQTWMQGRGPGNPNCAYYSGYRNCPQGWATNPQARRGRRWSQPFRPYLPQEQPVMPEATP